MRVAMMADDPRAEVDAEVKGALLALADFLRKSGVQVDLQARPADSETSWRVYISHLRGALCGQLTEASHPRRWSRRPCALACAASSPMRTGKASRRATVNGC